MGACLSSPSSPSRERGEGQAGESMSLEQAVHHRYAGQLGSRGRRMGSLGSLGQNFALLWFSNGLSIGERAPRDGQALLAAVSVRPRSTASTQAWNSRLCEGLKCLTQLSKPICSTAFTALTRNPDRYHARELEPLPKRRAVHHTEPLDQRSVRLLCLLPVCLKAGARPSLAQLCPTPVLHYSLLTTSYSLLPTPYSSTSIWPRPACPATSKDLER